MTSTLSLLDRAGLDRDAARRHLARGLEGADDGELFLEYKQSEMLAFDNGRLKQATYDTAQGFGLRAVKDEAVGYAHASDLSDAAVARAAEARPQSAVIAARAAAIEARRKLVLADLTIGGFPAQGPGPSGAPVPDGLPGQPWDRPTTSRGSGIRCLLHRRCRG